MSRAHRASPDHLEKVAASALGADPEAHGHREEHDSRTGRLRDDIWSRWLAWDPVRMVPAHADALRSLRAVWIDAGNRDDWYLDLAATAFRDELRGIGVTDVHYELFDATHSAIDYRYPLSLAYLAERLR